VLKLKLGSGDVSWDERILATARAAAPHATLLADVNGGWSIAETLDFLPRLAPYQLHLLEQPFHHHHGLSGWQQLKKHQPKDAVWPLLFADESVQNPADIHALAPYVDGINVKLLKAGSFQSAVAMMAAARQENLQILLGCMIESSIGITAAAHLAPWADIVDLDGHLYLAADDYSGLEISPLGHLHLPTPCHGIGARLRQPPSAEFGLNQ
jgi:L-Ala-D/L-Glu epimerase